MTGVPQAVHISAPDAGDMEGFALLYVDGSCNQYPQLFHDRPDAEFMDELAELGLKAVACIHIRPKPGREAEWIAGLPEQSRHGQP